VFELLEFELAGAEALLPGAIGPLGAGAFPGFFIAGVEAGALMTGLAWLLFVFGGPGC
jgi:hypothetical protein